LDYAVPGRLDTGDAMQACIMRMIGRCARADGPVSINDALDRSRFPDLLNVSVVVRRCMQGMG
jgi:hypothetical protein